MGESLWVWIGFNALVLVLLAIDLGVFNREAHVIGVREAARWTAALVTLALAFNAGIFFTLGPQPALEFFTGYLIELALSVDNVFVFVLIFAYFSVPPKYQHRVLFWGILGALLMRGAMIGAGVVLLNRFEWIIYIFGAFLVFTGIRMATGPETELHPEHNPVLKLVRRVIPVTRDYHGQKFFVEEEIKGELRKAATPLFVVLVLLETTDLIFAVDSIPAIFGVTRDPFLIYTSNVFAILGLRSLYFLLAGVIERFHYLKIGISGVLVFVGGKMLAEYFDLHVPTYVSLLVVGGVLAASVIASLLFPRPEKSVVVPDSPTPPADL
ncbi:MAG: TerC family protein [Longimicrobiaceae bacterium]